MLNFKAGLERTRLVSNVLMFLLLIGNIYFSIQYTEGIKQKDAEAASKMDNSNTRIQLSRFLKLFIDTVLNLDNKGAISIEDRVSLENSVRQLHDPALLTQWEEFVNSKDSKLAQASAVRLMSMITGKML